MRQSHPVTALVLAPLLVLALAPAAPALAAAAPGTDAQPVAAHPGAAQPGAAQPAATPGGRAITPRAIPRSPAVAPLPAPVRVVASAPVPGPAPGLVTGPASAPLSVPAPAPPPPAPLPPALDLAAREVEVLRLRGAMAREVPHLAPRSRASDAQWIELARAEATAAGFVPDRPQLLVVVDRSPRVQGLAVVMAVPSGAVPSGAVPGGADWKVVGATRVSTGSQGRYDHYITPRGVFHVTDAILGYRAEGTLNENGIRGLGAKGMRVWDFGWQRARKGWTEAVGKPDSTPIRLEMHATDPDKLEQRIGQPASQGCIRIPTAMNVFLDRHGVLDAEYERRTAEPRYRALLRADRTPSPLAGNTLVVVDSAARPGTPDQLGGVVVASSGK